MFAAGLVFLFGLVFTPDNKHLLTCSRDKTAKVWDLSTKESVLTFPDHQNPVYGLTVKPDGKIAISAGEDNQIRYWNTAGEAKLGKLAWIPLKLYVELRARRVRPDALGDSFWMKIGSAKLQRKRGARDER